METIAGPRIGIDIRAEEDPTLDLQPEFKLVNKKLRNQSIALFMWVVTLESSL